MEDSSSVLVDFYGFLRWYGVYCEYCLYLYLWFDYLSPAGFETQMLHSFVGGMLYHCEEAPQCIIYDVRVGATVVLIPQSLIDIQT